MSAKPHLIGISGYAQTGKSSVGRILSEKHGYTHMAFADKLRDLAAEVHPGYQHLVEALGYEEAKRSEPLVRELLVRLGAGCRKVLGYDVWVDALLPIGQHDDTGMIYGGFPSFEGHTVVTDVRYANEALRIRALGGQLWHVERECVGPANEEEARSIALLPRADRYIHNNGGLLKLADEVERALSDS